ncbi:hypothetical protein Oter_1222 [Opitutus terrae PB90-1]|uniref:Uncharacterized protein n=1 Tax=Opitutus terrae (strain DSM 11246 / JCM 15787 / PB90-1) TaxID=452637 RepID=B1ZPI8_OPITP|nr:hypothetical protein Oter_1222 [Opitutus terrae PB90-1]
MSLFGQMVPISVAIPAIYVGPFLVLACRFPLRGAQSG